MSSLFQTWPWFCCDPYSAITGLGSLLKLIGHLPADRGRTPQVSFQFLSINFSINFALLAHYFFFVLVCEPVWRVLFCSLQVTLIYLLVIWAPKLLMQCCLLASLFTLVARKCHPPIWTHPIKCQKVLSILEYNLMIVSYLLCIYFRRFKMHPQGKNDRVGDA